MNSVKLVWEEGLTFSVEQNGHKYYIDGDSQFGGKDKGPRPKALLLSALAGCSGMDTTSILQKMRIPSFELVIIVEADTAKEQPQVYTKIRLIYNFTGENLPIDKLKRAVSLSLEKYCAVYAMLIKAVPIEEKIMLNGEEI